MGVLFVDAFVVSSPGKRRMCCQHSARWPLVALTREKGKNTQLENLLLRRNIRTAELPCVQHVDAEDTERLETALAEEWEWVLVTSPEAARVLLKSLPRHGGKNWKVAAVGKATAEALQNGGLTVAFVPSRATAQTLCAELPGESGEVLYPTSARASEEVQRALRERGFRVIRLNSYSTASVEWSHDTVNQSRNIDVVTVGSPSALKAWIAQSGAVPETTACIGETSARASREAGVKTTFFSEKPGVEGWAASVEDAVRYLERQRQLD